MIAINEMDDRIAAKRGKEVWERRRRRASARTDSRSGGIMRWRNEHPIRRKKEEEDALTINCVLSPEEMMMWFALHPETHRS